jgi:PAS domain S-box-containing protein
MMDAAIWTQVLLDLTVTVGMTDEPEQRMGSILGDFLHKLDCSAISIHDNGSPPTCTLSIPSWLMSQKPFEKILFTLADELAQHPDQAYAHGYHAPYHHFLYRFSACGFILLTRTAPFPVNVEKELVSVITLLGSNCLSVRARKKLEQTERTLRNERSFLHALMDSTPDLIFYKDVRGIYRLANQAVCRLFSLSSEDIVGKTDLDLHRKYEALEFQRRDQGVLQSGIPCSQENDYLFADGSSIPYETLLSPYHDDQGELLGLIGIARDIKKRKEMESALARRLDFQNLLMTLATTFVNVPLEEMDDSIQNTLASAGMFTDSDRAYLFMYDFDRDIMSNTHEWCASGIEPAIDLLREVPCEPFREVWVLPHQNGETVHVPDVNALPDQDPLGEILRMQGILTLITIPLYIRGRCLGFIGFDAVNHVKLWGEDEITLLQVLAELFTNAEMRRRRELELIEARLHAELANRAKSEFLANMSHEIRTPLNGIVGTLSLLRETEQQAEAMEYICMLDSSVDSLLAIINDILDLSKLEAGKLSLLQEPFRLEQDARQALQIFHGKAQMKGLSLSVHIEPGMPSTFLGDRVRIRQILLNLISNAVKFTEKGHITLLLDFEPYEDLPHVRIRVQDTGIGIAPPHLEKLFQPFEQGDISSSKQYEGTGLGLAICHRLTRLMKGHILVESEYGKGSCFTVLLPLQAVDPSSAHPLPESGSSREGQVQTENLPSGLRVLLVDDHDLNRRAAAILLEKKGLSVTESVSGQDALSKLHAGPYDMVLMDIQMPGMDGYEATRRIRHAHTSYAQIPIIALSANTSPADREKSLAAGMDDHIPKPFQWKQLEDTLLRVLFDRESHSFPPDPLKPADTLRDSVPVFDQSLLLRQYDHDTELARDVLLSFLKELPEQLHALMEQIEQKNESGVRQAAHLIKGGSAYASATSMEAGMTAISAAARLQDWETCKALFSALESQQTTLLHDMHAWITSTETNEPIRSYEKEKDGAR